MNSCRSRPKRLNLLLLLLSLLHCFPVQQRWTMERARCYSMLHVHVQSSLAHWTLSHRTNPSSRRMPVSGHVDLPCTAHTVGRTEQTDQRYHERPFSAALAEIISPVPELLRCEPRPRSRRASAGDKAERVRSSLATVIGRPRRHRAGRVHLHGFRDSSSSACPCRREG